MQALIEMRDHNSCSLLSNSWRKKSKRVAVSNANNKWVQNKGARMVIILFFYLFYRFETFQNKSWGKWWVGHENPIMYTDKGSPLSSIGVNVVRITAGKLLMTPVKNWYSARSVGNALVLLSWRLEEQERKSIYYHVMQMNETPAVPTQTESEKF